MTVRKASPVLRTTRPTRVEPTSALPNEPIILVVGFNLLTIACMITAPIEWDAKNLPQIYFLVLACQLLIVIGFRLGRNRGLLTRPRTALPLSSGATVMPYLLGIYLLGGPISYG